jgi:hypothetical protein
MQAQAIECRANTPTRRTLAGTDRIGGGVLTKILWREPGYRNKHPKRVIDLLVSLDASHNIDKTGRCE